MSKLRAKVYLHGNKESMYDKGQEIGLTGEAADKFAFALYEVEVELEVDPKTGDAKIIKVDGKGDEV